jgi:hypothetical protein
MVSDPNFLHEAARLRDQAAETLSPAERRMLQSYARFYEALGENGSVKSSSPESDVPPLKSEKTLD